MKKFALIGAAGYIAPRHMRAIKDTENEIVAAYDPYDGVGVMDAYFPHASFFVEFERFDRHVEKLRRNHQALDFVTVCSPNYLHDSHIRFGLRQGADVVCEKPLVLNPWNIDALADIEKENKGRVYSLLQLRLHPSIQALKKKIDEAPKDTVYDVDLTYITARGHWYFSSWKGDLSKSGGVATNIGIHFFDMLLWIFGSVKSQQVHLHSFDRASGFLELERARVRWFMSVDEACLPTVVRNAGKKVFRSITLEGKEIEFSDGFSDLHTLSYQRILQGEGFSIHDSRPAIELAHHIRYSTPMGLQGDYHPLALIPQRVHPFGYQG